MPLLFALIHSPLTGPEVWWPVAAQLRSHGYLALVPDLQDSAADPSPYWLQHANSGAESISSTLTNDPTREVILVAHSGAGQLLGSIGRRLAHTPLSYLFVDAGMPPQQPTSRLEQMSAEDEAWAAEFEQFLATGSRFPAWSDADLHKVLPEPTARKLVLDTLRPRGLDYFTETLEPTPALPSLVGAYLQWTPTYRPYAAEAAAWNWPVSTIPAQHFHMLVNPEAVAAEIISLADRVAPLL